jgi:putative tryptophan/tyrosine transport system substrate-binding protein
MRRRDFIAGLVGAAAWPFAAGAQQSSLPLIGFMSARSPEDSVNLLKAFYNGLKEEGGYVDGESARLESRWARGNYGLLPSLARELVEQNVSVLVAVGGDASARAAKSSTSEIPIVFTISGDPVEAGLVQSINRPGGNATGCIVVSTGELDAKRLDLLRQIVPDASAFGVLVNPKYRLP